MHRILTLIFSLFMVINSSCGAEDSVTKLTFDVSADFKKLEGWDQQQDQPLPEATTSEALFYLSNLQYQIENQTETTRIDFEKNRIFTIYRDGAFQERSIFSDIAYRHWELANRDHVRSTLEAAGLEKNPWAFATSMSEHLFSVLAKEGSSKLIRTESKKQVVFKLDKELVFQYSKVGKQIPAKQIDQFWRAYRYEFGIHPVILRELVGLLQIPDEFVSRVFVSTIVRRRFVLKGADQEKDFTFTEASGKRTFQSDALSELYELGKTVNEEKYKLVAPDLIKQAVSLVEQDKTLEAMLRFLEMTLVTGGNLPEEFNTLRDKIAADENVQKLFASISPEDRESAEASVKNLEQLESKAGNAAFILKIFRANILSNLQNKHEPVALMNEAIRKNPYIAGLWIDIAKQYRSSYWDQDYWVGFDIARKLNPNHSMLGEVANIEKTYFENNREFFPPPER